MVSNSCFIICIIWKFDIKTIITEVITVSFHNIWVQSQNQPTAVSVHHSHSICLMYVYKMAENDYILLNSTLLSLYPCSLFSAIYHLPNKHRVPLGTLRDKREASRVLYYNKCIYLIDCYIVDDKCWLWRQRSCNESLLLNYSTHVIQWRYLCVLLFISRLNAQHMWLLYKHDPWINIHVQWFYVYKCIFVISIISILNVWCPNLNCYFTLVILWIIFLYILYETSLLTFR